MAGYSGTPLLKKLGIQEHFKIKLINAPSGYLSLLGRLPVNASVQSKMLNGPTNFIQAFVTNKGDLIAAFKTAKPLLALNGMVWICWPKGKSTITSTINREDVRAEGLAMGLVDVKVAAIDEDWSGLKFVYRIKDR